jgi:hypothetical protein
LRRRASAPVTHLRAKLVAPRFGLRRILDRSKRLEQFAREFAKAAGARVAEIDDGGITGRGFHDHCRKRNALVLQSPKQPTTDSQRSGGRTR